MKHKIEVNSDRFDNLDVQKNPLIFLKDETKDFYNLMDILEIKDKSSDRKQKRIVISKLMRDEGLKDGYVMLTLGEKANFDGCIATAVLQSVGQTRVE